MDASNNRAFFNLILWGLGRFVRVRYRHHSGSIPECLYALMTYGIPTKQIPIQPDGSLIRSNPRVDARIEMEKKLAPDLSAVTFIPGLYDCLLGRSKLSLANIGNMRYRDFITKYQNRFERSDKIEKSAIVYEVVDAWKKSGGRFLQEYYSDYVEVPDAKARQKVAHSFRTLRNSQRRRESSQATGCSTLSNPAVKRTRPEDDNAESPSLTASSPIAV